MTDEAMSPLRRRMIEDMTIRKLAPKTQQGYIRAIKDFAAFLGRSPDTASFEDVRRFQLHLAANGAHIPIVNHTVAALRFFFRITLRRSREGFYVIELRCPCCSPCRNRLWKNR
jgi:integrase/recombinase XerD